MKGNRKRFRAKLRQGVTLLTALATCTILSKAPAALAIVNGQDDVTSNSVEMQQRDATVFVRGCTGTLITPYIVLTAGHCGLEPNYSTAGEWVQSSQLVQVQIGADASEFDPDKIFRVAFVNYSGSLDVILLALEEPVPGSLATPVRALTTDAPQAAMLNPDAFWRGQQFRIAGWGDTDPSAASRTPNIRQTTTVIYDTLPCDDLALVMCAMGNDTVDGVRSGVGSGDSGGPVYWTDADGETWVIGVLQQPRRRGGGGGARFTVTFDDRGELKQHADHGDVPIGNSIASWLQIAMNNRPQDVYARSQNGDWPDWDLPDMVRAFSWFAQERDDNSLTTDSRWSAPPEGADDRQTWNKWNGTGQFRNYLNQSGYRLFRVEGFMFDPKQPQPAGTVPVFSWWSPERGDNFATTKPSWSMPVSDIRWNGEHIANGPTRGSYTLYRLEGFIYAPDQPQPLGTIPLYSWYAGDRGDNFATTQRDWRLATSPGARGPWAAPQAINNAADGEELSRVRTQGVGSSEYRLYRLEGYLPVTRQPE